MIDQNDIKKIKEVAEEFFQKMTTEPLSIEVNKVAAENSEISEVVDLNTTIEEPQILIGEKGQTLFEIQRLLRAILIKKIQKIFYLNLDINKYKQSKIEYLKRIAKELADEVSLTKGEKSLFPMSAYERRVIHAELSQRADIVTESQGESPDRHIVIKPR
ncbi:MAG: R3H domain-containing nucleic acid-binding protein [Patescibacteria group bacterium]